MSENSPVEHFEHAEHAEHAAQSGDRFLARVSVTIALLAVIAATVGSFETVESGLAITSKNDSVLLQNQASDAWAFFQAQSIKKNLYDLAAASDAGRAADYGRKARDYESEAAEARRHAEDLERERDTTLRTSDDHERRHHVLTAGVTLLHVAIAVATLSIIMRGRRWPWYGSVVLGALGAAIAAAAFL